MNVIIIEDESAASKKLAKMLESLYGEKLKVIAELESVRDSVKWLNVNPKPDIAFMDIQLSDGISFDIFKKCEVNFPVIFTTAYDEFMLESFEHNSIDYLLKPINEERLHKAVEKVKLLEWHFFNNRVNKLFGAVDNRVSGNKQRVIVKKGIEFISVDIKDIAYFFSEYKLVFLKDINGTKYLTDKSLTDIHKDVGSEKFFRLNRQFLANINSVRKFKPLSSGKIEVELEPATSETVNVSKESAASFRKWINR